MMDASGGDLALKPGGSNAGMQVAAPSGQRDVSAEIHALRSRAPVHKGYLSQLLGLPPHERLPLSAGRNGTCVLSYEACQAAFRQPELFSSSIIHRPNPLNELSMSLIEMDGMMHRAYRRTIQPRFLMAEALDWWRRQTIDTTLAQLIARLERGDRAELDNEFCARLPVYTITSAIGMTGDDAVRFRYGFIKSGKAGRETSEKSREAEEQFERMLLALVEERRREPCDDLISFLLGTQVTLPGQDARPLTDREIMHLARLVMVAGGDTTWRQLGITLFALLTSPRQLEAVKADRTLVGAAIDEAMRWNPTASLFHRMVMEDTEFYGVPLKEGDVLELCLGAANRDPERWEDPDRFEIHRPHHPNMTFGLGKHRCLGMNVAKVEMTRGINLLLDAFPRLRLDPDQEAPMLSGGVEQRRVSKLPVLLR